MKRMSLIAVTLCLLLLATVGAGVVVAKQEVKAPQDSKVVQFDVTYGGEVVGKLVINTIQQTFVFNGKGLTPGTEYFLIVSMRSIGSAEATNGGTVHIQGTWLPLADLTASPTFELSTSLRQGLGCIPTVLTAKFYNTVLLWATVYGKLTDGSGNPIANQKIRIATWEGLPVGTTYTKADGGYSYTKFWWGTGPPPRVVYDGNGIFCGTYVFA